MKKTLLLVLAFTATALLSASAAEVKEIYEKQCAKCHGPDGKGDTKLGKKAEVKDFTDAAYQAKLKDEEMAKAVKEGVKDGEKVKMKPAENVSDEEIKGLVSY